MKKKRAWFILIPAAVAALAVLVCLGYLGRYYHADAAAREALVSDGVVQVTTTDFGWLFDGPSEDSALIFYPGGKVEAAAYAPLCQLFARSGADVCLVEMPVRLALFGRDKASGIMDFLEYDRWYLAGHSLGGVAAASYAAEHGDELAGLVLLASYPTKQLDDSLDTLLIYGSEDGVLNFASYQEGLNYVPESAVQHVIAGGNHAQFGSYGPQAGDGEATISRERQMEETAVAVAGIIAG